MGANESKFTQVGFAASAFCAVFLVGGGLLKQRELTKAKNLKSSNRKAEEKKKIPVVNSAFISRLFQLLKIMIPGIFSAELGLIFFF